MGRNEAAEAEMAKLEAEMAAKAKAEEEAKAKAEEEAAAYVKAEEAKHPVPFCFATRKRKSTTFYLTGSRTEFIQGRGHVVVEHAQRVRAKNGVVLTYDPDVAEKLRGIPELREIILDGSVIAGDDIMRAQETHPDREYKLDRTTRKLDGGFIESQVAAVSGSRRRKGAGAYTVGSKK